MMAQMLRKDVPEELTWDLSALYHTRQDWEKELKALKQDVAEVTAYKGKLASSSTTLLEAFRAFESFYERLVKVRTYALLRTSTDGADADNQADLAKTASVIADINAELSFFKPELLNIPEETIKRYMAEEKDLQTYEKVLSDIIEEKPHTLAPEMEELLARLSEIHDAPYMIYERTKQADMDFPSFEDDEGNRLPLSEALYEDRYEISPNTTIRRNAYEAYVDTLAKYQHTTAAVYATEVTKQIQLAKIRNYKTVTEMLLQPHQVTVEMYENQLNIIQQELAPHMRKLAKLKERKLGLDKMTYADLKAPLDPGFKPETTIAEAKEMISDALSILGPEYLQIIKDAFEKRWIDFADNVGKQSGAFCASPYGANSFILLTWTNMMRGTFTLAHELGHAGHFQLTNKYQTILNTEVSTYFVEAPSTLNELLLGDYLLNKSDDERMKAFVINNLLDTYYHNFVTHLLEAELQRRVYALAEAGTPLTADVLRQEKYEAIKNFWGEDVDIPESAGLIWMRQPHYYMGLYPYTYSAGLTIATAVMQRIKQEGDKAVNDWLNVLKAGSTLKPLDLAKMAGVDMTNPDTIKAAVAYVGSLVEQLEAICQ